MRRARPLLGTIVDITADGAAEILPAAMEAAFASIEHVQRLMSFHDPDSDVSRINSTEVGHDIGVDPHTFRVLDFARQLSDLSGGLFDVTIAVVLVRNGFLPKSTPGAVPVGATYRDLDLLPGYRVRWRGKGWIVLGGIAKGYAVDCAIAALRSRGIAAAIVNAGGDLRCFGKPQPIHVRHPGIPTMLMHVGSLSDAAMATSSGYFSGKDFDGCQVDPLVDPKGRCCTSWDGSISVVARDGMTADALTKVVRLAPDSVPEILECFGAQAIVIDREGSRSCGRRLLQEDFGT
jgi:thiamine biosynthesis lipoprotein